MRRLVRFVGPARPEVEEATGPPTSSEPMSSVDDPAADRPLDVAPGGSEQMPEAGIVDAVAREA